MDWIEIFFWDVLPIITNAVVWANIPGEAFNILKIGRSKNGYKKLKKTLSVKDRIFKFKFIGLSKGAKVFQWYFVIMTNIGYLCITAFIVILIVSTFTHNLSELLMNFMRIKCYTFELAAFIFTLINIRSSAEKKLHWKFEDEYKI